MKRRARFLSALPFALLVSSAAHAHGIAPFDAYYSAAPVNAASSKAAKADHGLVASVDPGRGTPTFYWAERGVPLPADLKGADLERIALHHLQAHASLWGLTPAAIAAARPVLVHDTGWGGIIVVFRQKVNGVELVHSDMKVLTTQAGELVALSGGLHPSAVAGAEKKLPGFKVATTSAVSFALQDAYGVKVDPQVLGDLKKKKAGYGYVGLKGSFSVGNDKMVFERPARVKKVYYPMPGTLVPAYYVELHAGKKGVPDADMFGYVIAADDGRVLMRHDLTASDSFQYRVWADPNGQKLYADGPLQDFNPHPTGVQDLSISGFATPSLVSMESFNTPPGGAVDPWLPAGATESKGNNVDAYTDQTDCNPTANTPCTTTLAAQLDGFTAGVDIRATTTAPGAFDRTFDVNLGPLASQDQSMAAIAQLFYTTNWLHDYWYDSGFDEEAGNAQDNNFGRGGAEGDHLRAEAQDKALGPPASRNNANMSTPPDGESPRMQMFLWTGQNDITLDAGPPLNTSLAAGSASFGPQNFDITNELILANDGVASVTNACEPLTNNVAGKIVLVDRGTCTFVTKATNVQNAGGVGMLLANNAANTAPPNMGGTDPGLTIPSLSTTLENGNLLKAALANGPFQVHMKRIVGVERDGTVDNNIISHEWGHYLHHRLVDCGLNQCRGESEGWADFVAMHQSIASGDNMASGTWALGQYALVSAFDEGYYGIRRLPYTRDVAKNPFTFKHIGDENALPNIPMGFGGVANSEVHNTGEIWAQMLFDAYTALQISGGHTFDESKRRMANYIVAGMILAPTEPTFTEQRDGILAAAAAADMADMLLMANNFAGRGAGSCAISPAKDADVNQGVVESYELKGRHAVLTAKIDDSVTSCDGDGILDGNEAGKLTIEVNNQGPIALNGTSVTAQASGAGVLFPSGNQLMIDLGPFEKKTVTLDIALDDAFTDVEHLGLTITAVNAGACVASTDLAVAPRANADDLVAVSTIDTVDSDKSTWSVTGIDSDKIWRRVEDAQHDYRWVGDDFSSKSDTTLESGDIEVAGVGGFVFTFEHAHSFEADATTNWDGAVIEITEDGGQTWTDVDQFTNPGYGGVISNLAQNPLADRDGYVGESAGYPDLKPVTLNFGSAFAGKTVRIRFRIGTDLGAGAPGWMIDNMGVLFVKNTPFSQVVADTGECNGVPVADAGPDQSVFENQLVQLDATASTDPEGDPLTFTWKQNAGPAATLFAGGTATPGFLAPTVAAPTTLTFEVMVSDGKGASSDTVDVLVNPEGGGGAGGGGAGGGGAGGGGAGGGGAGGGGEGGATGGEGGSGGETTSSSSTSSSSSSTSSSTSTSTEENPVPGGGGCGCTVAGDDSAPRKVGALGALVGLLGLLSRRRRKAR